MMKKEAMKLFKERKVRTVWDEDQEKWCFSIVGVVPILTDSLNSQIYWQVLKKQLLTEGNETVTNRNGLKLVAADGIRKRKQENQLFRRLMQKTALC